MKEHIGFPIITAPIINAPIISAPITVSTTSSKSGIKNECYQIAIDVSKGNDFVLAEICFTKNDTLASGSKWQIIQTNVNQQTVSLRRDGYNQNVNLMNGTGYVSILLINGIWGAQHFMIQPIDVGFLEIIGSSSNAIVADDFTVKIFSKTVTKFR